MRRTAERAAPGAGLGVRLAGGGLFAGLGVDDRLPVRGHSADGPRGAPGHRGALRRRPGRRLAGAHHAVVGARLALRGLLCGGHQPPGPHRHPRRRHKCLAASYAISSASLAAVTLILALQVLQRIQVVTPMVGRQVEHLCNATTYIQMGSALECHWASHYAGEGVQPCGVACNWKVSMLQKGCHLMPQLCEAFDYQALPTANCSQLLGASAPLRSGGEASQTLPSQRLFVASAGEANCRRACDKDIQCRDFAHEEASKLCLHFSGTVALHAAPWAPLAPSQVQSSMKAATCWRRSDPMILQRFAMHNTRLATTAILLAIILGVSALCSFSLMYNMNHRRRRKPDASQLGFLMFCPCCAGRLHNRFNKMTLSDESSSEVS
ncbi:unnamed protein product [Effrenium voratum]|nr:unnamed protein product [Effrenium voratum]